LPAARESATSLYVPLVFQEKTIGLIKLGERVDRKPYGESDRYIARIIADYAASSVRTVDRLLRMEKISLRDPETRAYSAAFLADYFEKERYKAGRFRRPLSLVFLAIENFAFLMEQTRESLVAGALAATVEAIRKALRDSDLIARVAPDRFCIVLPETDSFGSMLALRRLRKAVGDVGGIQFLGGEFSLHPFFVSATYPRDGKDFQELSRLAEDKYLRQQKSPLHRMRLMEKSFWNAFDVLVGKTEYYELLRKGEEVPYFNRIRRDLGRNGHFSLPREMYLRLVESIAQDVASGGEARGLVIAAGPRPEIFKQIFLSFGSDATPGRNIYILGQSGSTRFDAKNLMYMTADDDRLKEKEIVLYLKENGAYGLFATGRQDEVCGFHTADEWLVEAMMEKVQEMYLLQGTF
jgi:diguanylate cyclase (GGDEF)-like protein